MNTLIIILLVVIGIAAVLFMWGMGVFNRLVRLKALLDEAWSGIDVQLKRRYDLIPNLVATVKQYGVHEKEIFDNIAKMRAASMNASGVTQKAEAEAELSHALRTLFAVVENYPNLKANENFLSLQKELSSIEHEIQLARRYYNGTVRNYNIVVSTFPSNIVASIGGFAKASYFEITYAAEREVPKVTF